MYTSIAHLLPLALLPRGLGSTVALGPLLLMGRKWSKNQGAERGRAVMKSGIAKRIGPTEPLLEVLAES